MQAVSSDYLAAIVAPVRQIKQTVNIDFINNFLLLGTITVSAAEGDPDAAPKGAVVDGKDVIHYLYALADPFDESDSLQRARMYPSDTLMPLDDGVIWFGENLSGDDDEMSVQEVLSLTYYTAMNIYSISWKGDDWLGRPMDFMVMYWDDINSQWVLIESVTGWAQPSWSKLLDAPITTTQLGIIITKVNLPQTSAKLIEFEGSLSLDATALVGKWEILEERNADSQTAPLGNSSSNQITLELDNTDNLFYRKSGSLYAPYLVANRRVRVQCGVKLENSDELVPAGTFYTVSWDADLNSPTARVMAWDRSKLMKELNFSSSSIYFNQTVSELVTMLAMAYGLTNDDMVIDDTTDIIPYAWFDDKPYWTHLTDLAEAEGGQIYFDESDRLIFENRSHLADNSTPVASLADTDTVIGVTEGWDQSKMRNNIQVTPKALQPDVNASICHLTDVLTVPGAGSLTLTLNYSSSPCINVQTPVITGGADISITGWVAYAWGGILTLTNSAGADETVTAISVNGQPLKESGGIEGAAEDTILIQLNGRRIYAVENQFIQSQAHAQALADDLLPVLSDPGARITVESRGRPELQLADALATGVARMGIGQNYWLTRNRMTYDGGLAAELTLLEVKGTEVSSHEATLSVTVSGSNRLLVVIAAYSGEGQFTTCNYGGAAMLLECSIEGNQQQIALWTLVAPATGTANVTIDTTAGNNIHITAIVLTDINQDSPVGGNSTSSSESDSPSVAVETAAGDYVVGAFIINDDNAGIPSSRGENQSVLDGPILGINGAVASTETDCINPATESSTEFTWTCPNSAAWEALGIAIKPIGGE